jgi:ABC-type transporter Mla subunit MlaD
MKELSNRDIDIAKMIWNKASLADIAKKYACSTKTIQRKQKEPAFAAYFSSLKKSFAEQIHDQVQEVVQSATLAKIELVWSFNESARRLIKIADDPKAKHSDVISAIRLLNDQYGITRVQAPANSEAAEPDVYQAEWMRKPQ